MSDENDVIRRLTDGNNLPQDTERHNIVLCPTQKDDPPGLLRKVADDIKRYIPDVLEAGHTWTQAKSREAEARANRIQAEAISKIGRLENERLELVQRREEKRQEAAINAQRDRDAHDKELRKWESDALEDVVECIAKLKKQGIMVSVRVIEEVEKEMIRRLKSNDV